MLVKKELTKLTTFNETPELVCLSQVLTVRMAIAEKLSLPNSNLFLNEIQMGRLTNEKSFLCDGI